MRTVLWWLEKMSQEAKALPAMRKKMGGALFSRLRMCRGMCFTVFSPPPFPLKEMVWVGPGVSYFSGYK